MEEMLEELGIRMDRLVTENEELKKKIEKSESRLERAEEFYRLHEAWLLKELNFKQEEILDLQKELLILNAKYKLLI